MGVLGARRSVLFREISLAQDLAVRVMLEIGPTRANPPCRDSMHRDPDPHSFANSVGYRTKVSIWLKRHKVS